MSNPADPKRLLTRQELYERIRAGSKDEVIVEEMVRLGFWELGKLPEDPAEEALRVAELERKIRALATEGTRLGNTEAMKAELHKRRLRAARERREETKRKRAEARAVRAKAWEERKRREILWLGEGKSHTLSDTTSDVRAGLPTLTDAASLADAMGIPVRRLRFLAFHRAVSTVTHYRRFRVPKKTGGLRTISAPMPALKAAQAWILANILEKLPLHDAAHGFVAGRSIVTNAAAHVGKPVVVNLDLKDFFPTLTYPRVVGLFRGMGYSGQVATLLALLCTEAEVEELELDGKRYYVHASERRLPQGSPASPAITNLVCVRLDQRLSGLARTLGLTYTRYADDLTFSGPGDRIPTLLGAVRAIVTDEGFEVHPDKTRVMRRGRRQEVTGLVVNDRLGVPRDVRDRWRAVLHQVRRDGPADKRFGPGGDVIASLLGFAAFVHMVDPDVGGVMLADARELARKVGWKARRRTWPAPKPHPAGEIAPAAAASGTTGGAARGGQSGASAVDGRGGAATGAVAAGQDAPAAEGGTAPADAPKRRWWEFWKWFS